MSGIYHIKIFSFSCSASHAYQVRLIRRSVANPETHFLDLVQEFEDDMAWEGDDEFDIYVQEAS